MHNSTKLLLVAGLLLLNTLGLLAQQISGRVTDDAGEPLIGASILIAGTSTGTVTDIDGDYELAAATGDSLVVSYTGYATQTVAVPDEPVLDIVLGSGVALNEVVVTSLGISRDRKSLGYAVAEVDGEQLVQQRTTNLVQALQGQAAGVQITQAGGGPGQAARIIIRGINSLDPTANNEPLFVVDGIPISNETNSAGGGSFRNVSNRASDINPQDIESISILKGGAATALYGLRAANGAVIITTKKGQAGQLRVNFSTTVGTEEINKVPDVQRTYTQGFGGEYDPDSFWPTWGSTVEEARAQDPTHPATLFNNYENGYQRGQQFQTNLSLTGGSERATFLTSLAHATHEGVIPFSNYANTNFRVGGEFKASDKFTFGGTVNYINSGGDRVNANRYNESLSYWSPRVDVFDYAFPDGTMKGYRNDGRVGNNPVYGAASNKFTDDVNRYVSNVRFSYAPTDFLRFNYVLGLDNYTDSRLFRAPAPQGLANENVHEDNGDGFVEETRIVSRDLTSNITGILNLPIANDLDLQVLGGFDVFDSEFNRVGTRGEELDIFNLFSLNNAAEITTSSFESRRRLLGLYGDVQLAYRNAVYLSLTGRNDWSSTLPVESRSFFYPSVSASVVFSELLDLGRALDFGKLRVSYAGIGKDTRPYSLSTVYVNPSGFPIDGTTGWARGSQRGSNTLVPERTNTFEVGVELRAFQNRARLEVNYYDATSNDQIIPVPVSLTTGFSSFVLNAGSIRNNGVELVVGGSPIKTNDFTWDIGVNFTRNYNEVVDIADGVEEIFVGSSFGYAGSTASIRLVKGEPYGNIYGRSYKRFEQNGDTETEGPQKLNRDAPIVIGANGFPVIETEQKILGNTQPNWFGALNTSFTYKSLSLRLLIDTRQGVQKFNQLGNWLAAFGIADYTENRDQTVTFEGVLADGTPNTKPVFLGQGTGPDGVNYGAGFYRNTYRGSTENFVEDADWIRLRNASLSYQLPQKLFDGKVFKGAGLTLTGNNLLLATPFSGFDPEGNDTNSNGSDGLGGFTYPAVRSFFLTLNVSL